MDRTKNHNNSMPDCSELTKFLSIQDWSICRRISSQLIYAIDDFVQTNSNLDLVKYQDILQASGVEWDIDSMTNADVDSLDIVTVLALLVAAYRADHFSNGAFDEFIQNGSIRKWLVRLEKLTSKNNK